MMLVLTVSHEFMCGTWVVLFPLQVCSSDVHMHRWHNA